jgi:hypothetical protein
MAGHHALAAQPLDALHCSRKLAIARIGLLPLRLAGKQGDGLGK